MSIAALGRKPSHVRTAAGSTPGALTNRLDSPDRSNAVFYVYQELARAHLSERQREAERIRRVQRVASARRSHRKAEKVALRARLAALAVN